MQFPRRLERQHIYDGVQRLLHWGIAFAVFGLLVTGLVANNMDAGPRRAYLWLLHIDTGKLLITVLFGRLVWGFVGPEHARLTALIHPSAWRTSFKKPQIASADGTFGHHPQASLSYLGFYGLAVVMGMTGLLLAGILRGEGPLGERVLDRLEHAEVLGLVHEVGAWSILAFILTHVGALLLHEWRDGIPLAQSMISGFQYRSTKERSHGTDQS